MKKIYTISLFLFLSAIAVAFGFLRNNQDEKIITNKNINLLDNVSISEALINEIEEDENGELLYKKNGVSQRVTYKDQRIFNLAISPEGDKASFYYESGNYLSAGRDISLVVMNIATKEAKQIYENTHRTSYWEWLNNNEIIVYCNCGTECMIGYVINAETGRQIAQLNYGVGYEWSPNKEYVLAYNYSGKYGVTVGDKNGNVFLSIKREPSDYELIGETKAAWSSDSQKIALIIKKEEENKMELLVFNKKNDFKQIFQADVNFSNEYTLDWINDNKLRYNEIEVNLL